MQGTSCEQLNDLRPWLETRERLLDQMKTPVILAIQAGLVDSITEA